MQDEYNEIHLTNDATPVNADGLTYVAEAQTVAATQSVEAAQPVGEIADVGTKTESKAVKTSKAVTRLLTTVSVVAIAASAVVVATAEQIAEKYADTPPAEEQVVDPVDPVVPVEAEAPRSVVSDVSVDLFAYYSTLNISFTLSDPEEELSWLSAWVEDAEGNTSECAVEETDGACVATVTLSASMQWESGLSFVLSAVTYEGWEGELCREELSLPAAPDLSIVDIGIESLYDPEYGEGDVYLYFSFWGDETTVVSYEYWMEDGDGTKYACTAEDYGAFVTLPTDPEPAFDIYGQIDFVASVLTEDGWQGEICRETFAIGYGDYSYPSFDFSLSAYLDLETDEETGIVYLYPTVYIYDPDQIWTSVLMTITDANGQTFTCTLSQDNAEIGYETDEYGTTTYYVTIDAGSEFTLFEEETVVFSLVASWREPDGNGGYNEYDSELYNGYVYVYFE